MKNFSIRIEDDVAEKIDNLAKMQDRNRSYIINKAINKYIEHEEYILEQINEGIKDLEEGRFYSFDEVQQDLEDYIKNAK